MLFSHARALVALILFASLSPVITVAQTRFQAADTTVDLGRYTTVDDCVGAVMRMQRDIDHQKDSRGGDTLPEDRGKALAPAPTAVTELAARCAARFTAAAVDVRDLNDFYTALTLFLAAGRDSDGGTVVARRLAAITPKDTAERAMVIDTAIKTYVTARPARLAAAEALLVGRARESVDRAERLKTYVILMQASAGLGDTARARRVAQWVVALVDSLTPAEQKSEVLEQFGSQVFQFLAMHALVGLQPRLDSLRKSTAAFVALERSYWTQLTRERGDALPYIGKRAETLTADYWFPTTAGTVLHPTPGRAALIVLLRPSRCTLQAEFGDFVGWICDGFLSEVRRIARRFPALEIDVVMATEGAFMYSPPPTPADEAAFLAKYLDGTHLPGAVLGVTSTPFVKLAEPDGRRVDRDVPNFVHYEFQKTPETVPATKMFLVDADGIMVEGREIFVGAWGEDELMQIIDALLQQRRTGS